ncbi:MAG TPA: RIP metalloprotease RseP [Terracidiphilus sp.]|nr:RIP metalloprotease RseP [Terracidiphilus sp.]
MHEFLVSVVAFIVLVGVMVVVHEFGHFAVAKLCGVRVESFSVGFGPRLFGLKYGDTDYKVCALPLGGYVKMTGETPDGITASGDDAAGSDLANDPGAFTAHPRWQRMLIGAAGPVANFILAFVLMLFYYGWINEVPKHEVTTTTVEWVVPGSAAAQAGLQPGDVIRRFEVVDNPDWDQVNQHAALNQGQTVPLTVDRGGQTLALSLHETGETKGRQFDLTDLGLIPEFVPGPIGVEHVNSGTPADQAGLRDGDAIQSVDGHAFHTVQSLLSYMQSGEGKPISLTVVRNGVVLPPMIAHPAKLDAGWKLGFAPTPVPFSLSPLPLKEAAVKSEEFCAENSSLIVEVLGRLFSRKISMSQLAGPVGIARMAGDAAETKGWLPKLGLASAISLNLGILNLMPFPILDGGLILLLLIESVIRRDIGVNVKERIYQAAFVVLIAFFAFVIFNDVTKLPIFTHLKP